MKKALFTLCAAAAVLVACDKNETTPVSQNSREVRFTTNIQTYTVKAALDDETVLIVAGAPINATTTATAKDSKLTPATKLYWAENQTAKTKFAAVYPQMEVTAEAFDYSVANGDFNYHKNVLFAASGEVAPETEVALPFKHPFAQMQVSVTNNLEGFDVESVTIGNVLTNSTVDLLAGTVTAKGEAGSIAATKVESKYNAILIPQTGSPEITVALKKGEEFKTVKFVLAEPIALAGNKIYTAAVTVNADEPVVQVEVSLGFSVTEWDAEATPMTYTEEPAGDEVVWSVVGLGDKWDVDIPMECTTAGTNPGEGTFEADITCNFGDVFKLRQYKAWDLSVGMKTGWASYATGAFDEGYLSAEMGATDIQLEVCGEMHIKFEYPSCRFIVTPKGETTANKGNLTVYVDDQSGWAALNLYMWNAAGEILGNWPGTAAPAETETIGEVVYKKWAIANELLPRGLKYILNDGTGNQTDDLETRLTSTDTKLFLQLKSDATVVVAN